MGYGIRKKIVGKGYVFNRRYKMRKRVAIVIGCVIVLLVLCVGCAPAAVPVEARPTAMLIDPVSGLAKTTSTLYGAGFVPGENIRVEVVMVKDGIPVAINMGMGAARMQWVANEAGAIAGQIRIPHSTIADPGVYTVTAMGDQGSSAVCPLGVLAPPEG